ncbi:MAG: VWA domain-containing protein [Deltaproteobacteria bacterium]|nr:VWA domain-containing protein [Deltaproteobacteria bacterium]
MEKRLTLLFFFLLLSCAPVRKFQAEPGAGLEAYKKDTIALTCDVEESDERNLQMLRKAEDYQFVFEPYCPKQGTQSRREDLTRPLNIVFVLDITGSMRDSVEAVKTGALDLARKLRAHNWDVRFAAVGFADHINEFRTIPFLDAETLQRYLGNWQMVDGDDFQEAGQAGVSIALDKLKDFIRSTPERKDSRNALIYVSDAPTYAEDSVDHQDFSVDALAKRIKDSKLANLSFFYSVAETSEAQETVANAPSLVFQMEELLAKSEVMGTRLKFPLDGDVLNSFSKTYVTVVEERPEICELKSASFVSSTQQGISSKDSRSDLLPLAMQKKAASFKVSPDVKTNLYWLTITRCCKSSETSKDCPNFDVIRFQYSFSK